MMKVPFMDLKTQYAGLWNEIEPKLKTVFEQCAFIGGTYVLRFEQEMAEYLRVKHSVGCGNGTDALSLALRACGVQPGDEVITTPFSFFATAEAIAAIGAVPVFVDVRKSDYTMDPEKIEAAITEKTRVILPVQIFGVCCDMDKITEIAHRHGLRVIEDDAQAIGSSYCGRMAGTLGDIGCFSFYPTKNLGGCGDGGMCTTNDDDLALILRSLREHGAGKSGARALELLEGASVQAETTEKATELYDPYKYFNYLIGYNSRLDAIQACVLSTKLRHLSDYNARRSEIAQRYLNGLSKAVHCPDYSGDRIPCWHQFAVCSEHKNELCRYLDAHGVGSGTFYPVPLHRQRAFHEGNCKNAGASLPVAEWVSARSVCLPIYPELSNEQVDYVIETVNGFYEGR